MDNPKPFSLAAGATPNTITMKPGTSSLRTINVRSATYVAQLGFEVRQFSTTLFVFRNEPNFSVTFIV
jgi:hypothetical protein